MLRIIEMNILKSKIRETRIARIGNQEVRLQCNITDLVKFVKSKSKEQDNQISQGGESL